MHILGGIGVALFFNYVFEFRNKNKSLVRVFIFTFLIFILWEIYEYTRGANLYLDRGDYIDSIKDLVMGVIGFFIALLFTKK